MKPPPQDLQADKSKRGTERCLRFTVLCFKEACENALISHLWKLREHSEAGKEEFGITLPCAVPWRFPKLTSKPVSFTLQPLLHFLLSLKTNGPYGPGFNIFPGTRYPHSVPSFRERLLQWLLKFKSLAEDMSP